MIYFQAFPFEIDWESIFDDPTRPLVVDVGSGNISINLISADFYRYENFRIISGS